ncbi:UNVERIFIED_CONTAM: hypothetical protein O8I53_13645 [Campylobacter lari]
MKSFILSNITNLEINNKSYNLDETINLNGKDILVKEIVNKIKTIYLTFTEDNLFIDINGNINLDNEKFIVSMSDYKIPAE